MGVFSLSLVAMQFAQSLARPFRACAVAFVAVAAVLLSHPVNAAKDVPFIAAPDHVTLAMLRVAGVGPRDFLIDLGSGDGKIVLTAAKLFGARALGVEREPERVQKSREYAHAAGIAHKAEFREQDIFTTELAQATVITMTLPADTTQQLRAALLQLEPGTRIVSRDADLGEWRPDRAMTVAVAGKSFGSEKRSRVYLWTVPARVEGLWCGSDELAGARLHIEQKFQDVEGKLLHAGLSHSFKGSFKGAGMRSEKGGDGRADFDLEDGELVLKRGGGGFKAFRGAHFTRATPSGC